MKNHKKKRIVFISLFTVFAFLFLFGFVIFRNASDKKYPVLKGDKEPLIRDVTISFKTPDFAEGLRTFAGYVDAFTKKTKEEFLNLPGRIQKEDEPSSMEEEKRKEE